MLIAGLMLVLMRSIRNGHPRRRRERSGPDITKLEAVNAGATGQIAARTARALRAVLVAETSDFDLFNTLGKILNSWRMDSGLLKTID